MKKIRLLTWYLVFAWLASPSSLLACAACFGKSDSNMARSLNAGIFSLLAVVVAVLVGMASFFVFLSRRAATLNAEVDKPQSQTKSC